ncbi:MAG: ISAs1 family transposase [Sphingobacteriales bacterium]|nr:ISAs1 family transposase [Sphingobacteriales bacterium]
MAAKSNEKTAIPELLDALELAGSIVSIDAIACQPHIAEQIRNKKADYALALKKNQGVLFEETVSRFSSLAAQLPSFEKVEYNGGRIEKRTCTVLNQLFFVDSAAKFKDCQSIIRIIAERTLKNQPEKTTQEVRYYLTSLDISPQNALTICRNHWGIENNLLDARCCL